jgi:acyl-CoA dehydrogenase
VSSVTSLSSVNQPTAALIARLLAAPPEAAPCEDVASWWARHRTLAAEWPDPMALAIAGGFAADRIGWAFASGYQAALRALEPGLPAEAVIAFCVTETGGNRPKDIHTALERDGEAGWRLTGSKRWTTLGPEGALFLVAARDASVAGERAAIKLVRVPSNAPGLRIEPMPPTRFVPEVPHAQLHFEGVALAAGALLPGDGYVRYVKPFRTVEDIHVVAAQLGYALREARRFAWPQAWPTRTGHRHPMPQHARAGNATARSAASPAKRARCVPSAPGSGSARERLCSPKPAAARSRRRSGGAS